ncbi:MAG: flippase-like domain-containing protein [Desulfobacterales bacterium]|nr:flippase-like domain-containing protein [Desulfobacterales bacterium]
MQDPSEKQPLYKQIMTWVAAAAILLFLFWRIDINQFKSAIIHANLYVYIPLMIFFVGVWFYLESQNLTALFSHFNHSLPYSDVLRIRGITYLLMIINYNLGIGGMALYLKKKKGVSLTRSASLMSFYMFSENICLSIMAAIGCTFSPDSSPVIDTILIICSGLIVFNIAIVLLFKALPEKGVFKKIKNFELLSTHKEAGLRTYFLLPFWRGLYFFTFIIFFYFAAQSFEIYLPFMTMAALVPIIFFIGNIPITPFGLGTIQAAMLYFFKDYGTEANILAFSIIYSTTLMLFRAPIGLYYLKKEGKAILKFSNNS